MTSIYSITSIETRLATHFSGYKTITLQLHFIHFTLVTPDILNKHETIVYSLCFKKQTLELLLHLFFKPELPTDGL